MQHADFLNGWDVDKLQRLVQECTRDFDTHCTRSILTSNSHAERKSCKMNGMEIVNEQVTNVNQLPGGHGGHHQQQHHPTSPSSPTSSPQAAPAPPPPPPSHHHQHHQQHHHHHGHHHHHHHSHHPHHHPHQHCWWVWGRCVPYYSLSSITSHQHNCGPPNESCERHVHWA